MPVRVGGSEGSLACRLHNGAAVSDVISWLLPPDRSQMGCRVNVQPCLRLFLATGRKWPLISETKALLRDDAYAEFVTGTSNVRPTRGAAFLNYAPLSGSCTAQSRVGSNTQSTLLVRRGRS